MAKECEICGAKVGIGGYQGKNACLCSKCNNFIKEQVIEENNISLGKRMLDSTAELRIIKKMSNQEIHECFNRYKEKHPTKFMSFEEKLDKLIICTLGSHQLQA